MFFWAWLRNKMKRRARNLIFFFACHLPRCQIGVLAGLLSTSHFRLTDIPSTIGIPKPGKRVIANDGVSETGIKQLVSMPRRWCILWFHRETRKKKKSEDIIKLFFLSKKKVWHRYSHLSKFSRSLLLMLSRDADWFSFVNFVNSCHCIDLITRIVLTIVYQEIKNIIL